MASLSSFETIFGAILTLIGVGFALIGLGLARASARMPGGERAEGRIVGFEVVDPVAPGRIHRPRVAFVTLDGTPVTATARYGIDPRRGRIGDVVTVFYDPADPHRVRVRTARALGSCMEAAFFLSGLALAAMGVVILTSS